MRKGRWRSWWVESHNVVSVLPRLAFLSIQLLDGFATTADSVAGRLPGYLRQAGFIDVKESHRERTLCGTMSLYAGRRPGSSSLP